MPKRQTIECGNNVVGFVEISSGDNFHIGGPFEPGPDFSLYEDAITAVRNLKREAESNSDVDWIDALETVNDYGFTLVGDGNTTCLLYTSPSPRDQRGSRMPSSA